MISAIITGTTSGIGKCITEKLLTMNYSVHGISRTSNIFESNKNYFHYQIDLTESKKVKELIEGILKKDPDIKILVNNAGVGLYGLHEELNYSQLEYMMLTNLVAPVLITKLLLRRLKENKGYIINISSVTAKKNSPIASAYSATKAGLTHFGESLFDEVRKSGVKIINIHPDMTKTNLYRDANFMEDEDSQSYLLPETIANIIEFALNQKEGLSFTDITAQPQKHKIRKKNTTTT